MVVVYFEKSLLNAVKYQFPNSKIVGCYFHFRQALQRKMTKLGVPKEVISVSLAKLTELVGVSDTEIIQKTKDMESDPELKCAKFQEFL